MVKTVDVLAGVKALLSGVAANVITPVVLENVIPLLAHDARLSPVNPGKRQLPTVEEVALGANVATPLVNVPLLAS